MNNNNQQKTANNEVLRPRHGKRKTPWQPIPKHNPWTFSLTESYLEEYPEIETKTKKRHDINQPTSENRKPCWRKDQCKFGDKCWFSHEEQYPQYCDEYTDIETKNNKRYYVDRDQPTPEYQKLCWWKDRCKFGAECWFSHEEQPF